MPRCPLCGTITDTSFFEDRARRYFRCASCDLVFLHADDRPLPLDETVRYLAHRNDPADAGYVQFLRTLADPVCLAVPVGAHGLDVGCGPTHVLAELLSATGRPTAHYDPLFFPDDALLATVYDFVTCCEVAEHAHDPAALFARLGSMLRPGGVLAVMTQFHGAVPFDQWWYRRDSTHVCFYSADTMRWLARRFDYELALPVSNVALFTVPDVTKTRTPAELDSAGEGHSLQ
jgi:SAM-dependent methyltransferase